MQFQPNMCVATYRLARVYFAREEWEKAAELFQTVSDDTTCGSQEASYYLMKTRMQQGFVGRREDRARRVPQAVAEELRRRAVPSRGALRASQPDGADVGDRRLGSRHDRRRAHQPRAVAARRTRAQELSLDDVARITKIQARILEKLEAGQLDGLARRGVRAAASCAASRAASASTRARRSIATRVPRQIARSRVRWSRRCRSCAPPAVARREADRGRRGDRDLRAGRTGRDADASTRR